jgi:hypothetical protein
MNANSKHQITSAKIEQLVKEFKMHICAMVFNQGFINSVVVKSEDGT